MEHSVQATAFVSSTVCVKRMAQPNVSSLENGMLYLTGENVNPNYVLSSCKEQWFLFFSCFENKKVVLNVKHYS